MGNEAGSVLWLALFKFNSEQLASHACTTCQAYLVENVRKWLVCWYGLVQVQVIEQGSKSKQVN